MKQITGNFLKTMLLCLGTLTAAQAKWAQGPYVGINGGIAHLKAKTDVNYGAPSTRDYNLADTNVTGDLLLGWGMPFGECWYGALDLSGGLSGLSAENDSIVNIGTNVRDKTTIKERYTFGVAAKIGHTVTHKTLAYLKLGVRFSNFKASHQTITGGVGGQTFSRSRTKIGFEPGLGIEVQIDDCWRWSAEYSYTLYKSLQIKDADGSGNGLPDYTFKPHIGRFTVGLRYQF